MDLAEAYIGLAVDEHYGGLRERDFALADPEVVMLTAALTNNLVPENRRDSPT